MCSNLRAYQVKMIILVCMYVCVYYLTLARMAITKKTNNKCWQRCRENGTLMPCWQKYKFIQPLLKTVWSFLKRLKIKLPHDPENSLLVINLKTMETLIGRDMCTLALTAALFTITNFWKQAECSPTDEWIMKMWYKYTMGYLSCKKEWNLAICNNC